MNSDILRYLLLSGIPFIFSLVLTPVIRAIALKKGIISQPRSDRWHKNPTALLGGVGIYLSFLIVSLLFGLVNNRTFGLYLGGFFLFIVGIIDDHLRLTPYIKLFMQVVASCIAVLFGIILGLPVNDVFAIPLTIFWIIAVTNSFNLLDNIDGLAAGIAAIVGLMLFFSGHIYQNNPLGIIGLIIFGSCLGFLPYNFNPAKIFMGDSGSMFLGYSLAVISVAGTMHHISGVLITLSVPVLILSVPIFDTVFVMIVRKIQGKKVFEGGKDHTSHHLVALGLSPKKTVVLLYFVSIIFGLISLLYSKVNPLVTAIFAFLGAIILIYLGVYLFDATFFGRQNKAYTVTKGSAQDFTFINTFLMHKRRISEVSLDFLLICVAYYSAYYLRFEGTELLSSSLYLIKESLPWIILLKLLVFFIFGLYRGVWRYISIADFLTIFKVVSLSSVVSVLFVTFVFRFRDYSRAVFFIDWLLLLLLITGSRFLFRIIGEFFSRIQDKGKRILIFGAGDIGEMVIREIKRNKSLNFVPIGFIDDSSSKIGNRIHGVSVLGTRRKMAEIIKTNNIHEVIIAISKIDIESLSEIIKICEDCQVLYRRVKGILDE
ncbi:MAG: hypothetical protein C4533_04050 [Candidatus Omnitrophota bacterium]|jgi:UDP-GlcNAc:undecaprenyl-phosphate GlcNAc-1-phosphate transferase|nr:MAG: hypothetical protein C4533_04050 [Candidatus Omnitrophota bacterium]